MRDKKDKSIDETEAALAVSIFLTNLLIFGGLGAIFRVMFRAINENGGVYTFPDGRFLP